MELTYLEWDSSFYQKKIYKCTLTEDTIKTELDKLKEFEADLIYIFQPRTTRSNSNLCEGIGAILYDKKVTYRKKVLKFNSQPEYTIQFEEVNVLTAKLEEMTYQSGEYSRFRMDPLLEDKFKIMYHTWIVKSLTKELADKVIVAKNDEGREIGFVTIGYKETIGKIGLIAVDKDFRGHKIGSQLLTKANEIYLQKSINYCEVVTQLENVPACKLYEKDGYEQVQVEYIYHYWKS